MKYYVGIKGNHMTSYSVIGPFTTEQLPKETRKFCNRCDYRPDQDVFVEICLLDNGGMTINEIVPYRGDSCNN